MINDQDNLIILKESLNKWKLKSHDKIVYEPYNKITNSLYRFGWFYINNYKYSISSWNNKSNIVVFENERNGEKIKFNIKTSEIIGVPFKKDNIVKVIFKTIIIKITAILKKLLSCLDAIGF